MRLIRILAVAAILAGCGPDDADVYRAVKTMGFTRPQIVDKSYASSWAGCGRDDGVAFDVQAVSPSGAPVNLLVCGGYVMKAMTVRVK